MNIINALKQYNSIILQIKKLEARIEVIDFHLSNSDIIRSSRINVTPYNFEFHSVVEESVCESESLEVERCCLQLELSDLKMFILNVDLLLDCLDYTDRYLLIKKYKENKSNKIIYDEYIEDINFIEKSTLDNKFWELKEKLKDITI